MPLDTSNLNTLWGSLLIEELIRNGIDYFCISPGSRSTPLTVAAARHPRAHCLLCLDERGAAFHALGYARAHGRPAVLICTSGTAAANYYPAVIEAAQDRLPLLVLSADRPPELRETGANQTIRQSRLFGDYVKWCFDLPCPEAALPARMVLTTVDQALHRACNPPAGPVHLNCAWREPLVPEPAPVDPAWLEPLQSWLMQTEPLTRYVAAVAAPTSVPVGAALALLRAARNGLLVVGRLNRALERIAVLALAQKLGWPVWADITSELRLGTHPAPVVHHFDQLLLSESLCRAWQPDTVLLIGDLPLSKRFLKLIEDLPPASRYLALKDHPCRHDPAHNIDLRLESDITSGCYALDRVLEPRTEDPWTRELLNRSQRVAAVLTEWLQPEQPINEIATARLVSEQIPAGHGLWLASSMPIRDMDMYASSHGPAVRVGANRGTSGIEGTIAAAAGFAAGLGAPVTVLVGDLALLHDLNSLALARRRDPPLVIVAINNDGGGIFSFLPIARFPDVFETCFGTPHGLTFAAAAELFALPYSAPRTQAEFVMAYQSALNSGVSTLIEVRTERGENHRLHQEVQRRIVAVLDAGAT